MCTHKKSTLLLALICPKLTMPQSSSGRINARHPEMPSTLAQCNACKTGSEAAQEMILHTSAMKDLHPWVILVSFTVISEI